MANVRNFGIVALVALALVLLPGGGSALDTFFALLTIVFLVAIAIFAYRMYMQNRFTLDSLSRQERTALYGSIGLLLLSFVATRRLFDIGGLGVLIWLALLSLASFGLFWVYTQTRSY